MLHSIKRSVLEYARCSRHNFSHLKVFHIAYCGDDKWVAKHAKGEIFLTSYPYLAMHDIEGYLKQGAWSIETGSTVIDAGGCFGEFALYASQCVGPGGRVLMLEPDADNIKAAEQNFALNGSPSNITIVPAALWNVRETLRFTSGQSQQSSMVSGVTYAGGHTVEVPAVTLVDLIAQHNLDRMDFVKMDIEGAELEACENARELPAAMRPRYAIASYHIRDGQPTAGHLEKMLSALGYDVSTGNPRHLTTWATSKTSP